MSIDETWLSTWFVNSYIRKCSELCPDNVSRLFNDVSTTVKLQKAVSAVVDWRLNTELEDKWSLFQKFEFLIPSRVSKLNDMTIRLCVWWITELSKVDTRLLIYFNALVYLQVASKMSTNGLSDELIDVLATISGLSISTARHINQHGSELSLIKATKLMKVVAIKSRGTVQLIEIELSKAYLHRALRSKDSDSDSIYCLANVYLAVLYYTTGQYQTAIDHCTLVMRSQCSSRVVQGELLPKIDDEIDTVLGLVVFYQYVLSSALNQQQTQYVSVFSAELLAFYFNNKFQSITKYSLITKSSLCDTNILQIYVNCISEIRHPFISDVLLYKSLISALKSTICSTMELVNCGRFDRFVTSETEMNASQLATLLQKSAIEHLTMSRQFMARQFASVATIVTTDFEALYAYKHGEYQRCLLLSTKNVHTLLNARSLSNVLLLPVFIELFDVDIVSLTALTLIVNPEYRKSRPTADTSINQMTLSLYLMTQCQLKLRHSLTSLAETLFYIKVAQRIHSIDSIVNQLTLKFAERKILMYSTMTMNNCHLILSFEMIPSI